MSGRLVLALCVVAAAVPRFARADTLACPPVEAGSIEIDGMLDDWEGVDAVRAGGKDKDQSFEVRCGFDGAKLMVVINVRDDQLVRLYKAKGKLQNAEDHVDLTVGGLALKLWPGTERHKPRRQMVVKKKAKATPKWLAIEDTQQPKGWSIELALPVAKLAAWTADTSSLDASVTFVDADDTEVHTSEPLAKPITLSLGGDAGPAPAKTDLYASFLRDAKLKKKDVVIDQAIGDERIVAGGMVIGLVGARYTFVSLPVDSAADVKKMQLVDLRGDGKKQVLTVLRQSGGTGIRDIIAVWSAQGGQIEQLFAVEVRFEADGNVLESTWKLRSRKKKKKGQELVVEAKPAVGWDEDTFTEESPGDAEPIHLPWDDARRGGVYWLDGSILRSKVLK
jgi:hypothetical protein